MYEKPIEAIATIVAPRDSHLAHVALPNGKKILAHRAKEFQTDLLNVEIGSQVRLEMTTYDFEKGRIVEVL